MFTLPCDSQPYPNCFLVNVTPQTAHQWLETNRFNRPLNQSQVAHYIRQIRSGQWQRTHQGIAFDGRGVVLDGQHRLKAIAESGITVPMLVFLNENLAVHELIDNGRKRSLLDVIRLELRDNTLKNRHILIAQAMQAGRDCACQNHLSAAEVCRILRTCHKCIRFAADLFDKSAAADNTVMGVIARAGQTVSPERLTAFCHILTSGENIPAGMHYLLAFRTWLLGLRDKQAATRRDIYKRTEAVLDAFIKAQTSCDMDTGHKEYFPLNNAAG